MAASYKVTRDLAKLSSPPMRRHAFSRGFRSSSRRLAAQNFTMPAMSPTMTEGNIANWKVTEGASFSTGDVLLEIETDKAQMDVEAQDDGKMAKITQQAGSKGVKVGSRIAIIAEADDDLNALSLTAEDSPQTPPPAKSPQSTQDSSESTESQVEAPSSAKSKDAPPRAPLEASSTSRSSGKLQKQSYPLYPSIAQLLHEKGLPTSEADNIPASGPKGRLLKGDVLAYLGRISSTYSADQSARISNLGHLDLSNIKPAPPKEIAALTSSNADPMQVPESEPIDTKIAIPISLSSVLSVQKRIQATLGVTLPLSTFIARATELANDDLPRSAAMKPSADELFNDVLGLKNVSSRATRGTYIPQITALPSRTFAEAEEALPTQPDVYDILVGMPSPKASQGLGMPLAGIMAGSEAGESGNVFSVSAAKGEEKRARVFLERVKTILQIEPGRLIL